MEKNNSKIKKTKVIKKPIKEKGLKLNNGLKSMNNINDNLCLSSSSPMAKNHKTVIKSFSSNKKSIYDYSTKNENKYNIHTYNNKDFSKNDFRYNSYTSKFYSNKNAKASPYNNIYYLDELLNKEIKKKEGKIIKMKKSMLKKVNTFLFKKQLKKNLLQLNSNNNGIPKTFSYSLLDNNSFEIENKNEINNSKLEHIYYIRKNLFPKTQKDNKFRKIKYVGDLLRNNNHIFKRFLLKQKENSEKLLFDIRKYQSMEMKNIQLGLALLKTKHKIYKCDKLLKYKYN